MGTLGREASVQRAHVVFVFLCSKAAIWIWKGKQLCLWNQRSIYPNLRCIGMRFIENISPKGCQRKKKPVPKAVCQMCVEL